MTLSNDSLLYSTDYVDYREHFFSPEIADYYFDKFSTTIEWRHEAITLFGKKIMQPRLTALYGNADMPYRYSGLTMTPIEWTKELTEIKEIIEAVVGQSFTTVLLNYYRTGHDSMGWHADNEPVLGKNPTIVSLSFGAERRFILRLNDNPKIQRTIILQHGSFLWMKHSLQHISKHCIPKQISVKKPRINLTFRTLQL
jgi:alkylated DNA repair dioxygenase AlkB